MDDGDPASPLGFRLHDGDSLVTKLSNVLMFFAEQEDLPTREIFFRGGTIGGGMKPLVDGSGCDSDVAQSIFVSDVLELSSVPVLMLVTSVVKVLSSVLVQGTPVEGGGLTRTFWVLSGAPVLSSEEFL